MGCFVDFKKPLPKRKKIKLEDFEAHSVRASLPDGPIFMCGNEREPSEAQIKRWARELRKKGTHGDMS